MEFYDRRWRMVQPQASGLRLSEEMCQTSLDARMLFYRWLKSKYANARIEEIPEGISLPRPFDAYAETERGKRFGYWIIVRGMRAREPMLALRRDRRISVQWIFLTENLKTAEHLPDAMRLTTTERDFMFRSKYDKPYHSGKTLRYLDIQTESLKTLRGLVHCEGPVYQFRHTIQTPFGKVLISPANGELVHPGEHECLESWEADEKKRQEKKKAESTASGGNVARPASTTPITRTPEYHVPAKRKQPDFEKALSEVKRRWREEGVDPDLPGWVGLVQEEATRLWKSWEE